MNPIFPSHLRSFLLAGMLLFSCNFLLAQGWQQTYPAANGYQVNKLSEAGDLFNVNLKNGAANALLSGFLADGSQLAFSTSAADCPIGFPGGNFQVSPLAFYNYDINASGDLRLRHIEFVPGDCGNIDQIYFDQIYDLPTASQTQVKAITQSADGQAVFVGGTYLVVPGNAPPEAFFFVKKISAFTGAELWSFAEPTPNSTSGNVPDVRFPLAVSDGGVIMMLPATPLTSSVLWRFDNAGTKVFGNVFGAGLDASVGQVIEAQDGGFFIRRFDFGATFPFPSFAKISATGALVFQGNSRSILENELNFFAQPITSATSLATSDGGFLITGKVLNTIAGDNGLYLIKLASNGSTAWVQFYDGLLPDLTHSIQTTDGGFLFAGKLNNERYLLRTDADGQITTCSFSDVGITNFCSSQNTADPFDDTWYASINPTGTGLGSTFSISGDVQASNKSYGQNYFFGPYATATSTYLDITITDDQSGCSRQFFIDNTGPCSGPCTISLGNTTAICDDNGTPSNPGDDFWYASIEPSGTGTGSTFSVFGDIQEANLAYGQAHLFGPFSTGVGNFEEIYIIDDEFGCSSGFSLSSGSCSNGGGNQIDLELTLAQPNNSPFQYSSYAVTATIQNNSNVAATGVQVSFAKPVGVVYTGGNEYTATQGSFTPFGNEVWTVGNLPANGSATLTVNYFLLANQSPAAYAQVTAANQPDADSSPNNGTPPTPSEDDESAIGGGSGGGSQQPDLTLANLDIQNSPIVPGDILTYNFDASNLGNGTASGDFTIKAWISTDNTLSADDIQDGTILTGNYGPGNSEADVPGASAISANLPDGNYFLLLKIDADSDVAESNEGNNMVFAPFVIGTSGGGGKIDLSLAMTTSNPDPAIYTSVQLTLTVRNDGLGKATGVKVSFPKPSGTVYTGGSEHSASQGNFNPFSGEVWNVGTLEVGSSATLTVSYFLLTGNALTLYAQVTTANEPDSDSAPNNGTCCTPNEDDEATLSLNAFAGTGSIALRRKEISGRPVQLQAIDPNPVYFGTITVSISSRVEGNFDLECYDLFGRLAFSQKVELREGRNKMTLDVSDLRSGTYYLNMPGQNWRYMPIRFVVTRW